MKTLGSLNGQGNNLNFLRLVAAFMVIYGHAGSVTGNGPPDLFLQYVGIKFIGGVAVDIFFLISGYLIIQSGFRHSIQYYLISRLLRIYPGLLACVCLSVFLLGGLLTTDSNYWHSYQTWNYLFTNIASFQTEYALPGVFSRNHDTAVNGSLWSLPIELRLYAIVFILMILGVLRRRLFFNLFSLFLIFFLFLYPDFFRFLFPVDHHRFSALVFWIGSLFWVNRYYIPISPIIFMALLTALFAFSKVIPGVYLYTIILVYGVLFLAFYKEIKFFKLIPDISYGIYLYGWICQQIIFSYNNNLSNFSNFFISSIIATLFGLLSWYLIESKFLTLKKFIVIKNNNYSDNEKEIKITIFKKIQHKNILSFTNFSNLNVFFLLLLITVFSNIVLVSNPGYSNHDELQKLDHVIRYGLHDYISNYVKFYSGDNFGVPIRPFSFMVQGLIAPFMTNFPVAIHLLDVLVHSFTVFLVYILALLISKDRKFSLIGAVFFSFSPLAVYSVGMAGALMDRWYVLFAVTSLIFFLRFIEKDFNFGNGLMIILFSFLSIASKETAIVFPLLPFTFAFLDYKKLLDRKFWIGVFLISLPILLFIALRSPAIINSLKGAGVSGYAVSSDYIFRNTLIYFTYPFIFNLNESVNFVFVKNYIIIISLSIHILLIYLLFRFYSIKIALLYIFLYFIFLLPIIPINQSGAHYLYGSAIPLSFCISAILIKSINNIKILTFFFAVTLILLSHSIYSQISIYAIGDCMNKLLISTQTSFLSAGKPSCLAFKAQPGSMSYILGRTNTGREQVGTYFPVRLHNLLDNEMLPPGCVRLEFNSQCIAVLERPIK